MIKAAYRPIYTCNFCCDFQCDFLFTDVKEWINNKWSEYMFLHLNIRVWFTRSYPSKGENRTTDRSKSCKCKRAFIDLIVAVSVYAKELRREFSSVDGRSLKMSRFYISSTCAGSIRGRTIADYVYISFYFRFFQAGLFLCEIVDRRMY